MNLTLKEAQDMGKLLGISQKDAELLWASHKVNIMYQQTVERNLERLMRKHRNEIIHGR